MNTVTEGRIVHYTRQGLKHCVAAIIVRAWTPEAVNLRLFLDGSNDPGIDEWATSVCKSDEMDEVYGFWHWPQECPRGQS